MIARKQSREPLKEDQRKPLSGRASRATGSRSSTRLLFLGHMYRRRAQVLFVRSGGLIQYVQKNLCTSCPYIGRCLGRLDLTEAALVRRPGAEDFGLFDELTY